MEIEKKIKVLQVFGSLNMGGAESRMMDIYRHMNREECQYDFLCLQAEEQYFEQEISKLGGNIYKISSPRECGILKHIKQLRECIKRGKYQAIHAHTSYHSGLVMLVAWLERVPVRIAHARTTGSIQEGMLKKIFFSLGRILVVFFSTHRIAISQDAGKFLFGKARFEVIPNAINVEKYLCINKDKIIDLKKSLNIPEKAIVIGQVGRFNSMKNHEFTVHWFAQYLKKEKNACLIFVGDGELKKQIVQKVDEYNIKDKVIFTGIRNDVHEIIHTFDVVFFPSKYEGLGGVVLEAQAAGVPIVESDTLPIENDLGLGLVARCSLEQPMAVWNQQVDKCRFVEIPDKIKIKEAFEIEGYSVSRVANRYLEIYRSF